MCFLTIYEMKAKKKNKKQNDITLRGMTACSDKAGTSTVNLRSKFVIIGGRSCLWHTTRKQPTYLFNISTRKL